MTDERAQLARALAMVAADLDAKRYPLAGVVRQAAHAVLAAPEPAAGGCRRCGAPLQPKPRGRPPSYCGSRCRRAAWRSRKQDEMTA